MNVIVSLLLWIGAISPNSTYTTTEISSLQTQYAPVISIIEATPGLEPLIVEEEAQNVINVVIIDNKPLN